MNRYEDGPIAMMNRSDISIPVPAPALFVLNRLRGAGYPAYLVGGCVRDALMGRIPGDYDVTTAARPDDMLRVFSDCRVVETGLKHGTLTVVREHMNIEVTTYRIDGAYSDGRRPDSVSFADRLSDDLSRRDFTVNAMAWAPGSLETDGGLTDLFGGREDLERRIIRCVGRAEERFSEDGLRILRALRFSSVLRFTPDPECAAAVRSMAPMLEKISRERIYAELTKLLGGGDAGRILMSFPDVIAGILPPLTAAAVGRAALVFENADPPALPPSVRYAVLLDTLPNGDAAEVMASLKPSRDEKRAVMNLLSRRDERDFGIPALRRLMGEVGDGFPRELALFLRLTGRVATETEETVRTAADGILSRDDCRRLSGLAVNGADLGALGLRGAEIGETLHALLGKVIRDEVPNDREALLASLRADGASH